MRLLIPLVFLLLAVWMLIGAPSAKPDWSEAPKFDPEVLSTSGERATMNDPARVLIGGVQQSCHDCHALFQSPPETLATVYQHTHIRLDHGLNDRCLNCHDRENRDLLALQGTQTVGYDQVVRLCAKCHGPTYRDWELGIHGRTNGYWDSTRGERRRLICTQCHDPHAPAFPRLAPLPGPHTLRMGPVEAEQNHDSREDGPLHRALRAAHQSKGAEDGHE